MEGFSYSNHLPSLPLFLPLPPRSERSQTGQHTNKPVHTVSIGASPAVVTILGYPVQFVGNASVWATEAKSAVLNGECRVTAPARDFCTLLDGIRTGFVEIVECWVGLFKM